MSVAVENVRDVSSMGQQAQDVYSSAPEAMKADIHLAFRSERRFTFGNSCTFHLLYDGLLLKVNSHV